jgi:AMMECR1 domain-containing protein
MPRSVLLQLARDSIAEVLEMQRTIDKQKLLQEHPLLEQNIATKVSLYISSELRGSYESTSPSRSLIDDIIINAKKAAFEDVNFKPITTAEYLNCELELQLVTPDGVLSEKDPAILKSKEYKPEKIFQ